MVSGFCAVFVCLLARTESNVRGAFRLPTQPEKLQPEKRRVGQITIKGVRRHEHTGARTPTEII